MCTIGVDNVLHIITTSYAFTKLVFCLNENDWSVLTTKFGNEKECSPGPPFVTWFLARILVTDTRYGFHAGWKVSLEDYS